MASQTTRFEFEELPLVVEGGFDAGLVAGCADISYHRDGEWSVETIYLDGFRKRSNAECATMRFNGVPVSAYERKPVELDAGTPLFNAILHRLEHEWADAVQEAVNEARVEDHARVADDVADYRRDQMREAV